jgi:N-acetylmuramoyl-L-alanine amidase
MRARAFVFGLLCLAPTAGVAAGRPDRALFYEARAAEKQLRESKQLQTQRLEWTRVALRYRRVVAKYPQSAYCDDALLAVGDLYREMAGRFKAPHYDSDAVAAYKMLVSEYPSSGLAEKALFSVFEIARDSGDRQRLSDAARSYLDTFPDSPRADVVKAAAKRSDPVRAASLPSPPPRGLAQVFNLRFWTGDTSTRVVIDLERRVDLRQDRITGPDRLYVDLVGTRLHPNLTTRSFPVGDGLLKQIRIAQNQDDVVRVVLDFKDVKDHSVVYMDDPTRLVIDVRGQAKPRIADAGAPTPERVGPPEPTKPSAPPSPMPSLAPSPRPPNALDKASETSEVDLPADKPRAASNAGSPSPAPSPTPTSIPIPSPSAEPSPAEKTKDLPEARRTAVAEAPSPTPPARDPSQLPQANRTGNYSLARQLGLSARRIVLDPGHGGQDPGTIGHGGLQEKDLVLDVSLRLEKMLRAQPGTEVIMTRSTDAYVPLEERTAIANSKGADLFLSVHANSSRSPSARGIETYILNFAVDPHAEEVAARENAISAATLKDLQGLVKAIALNSKIDESRDFATSIHEAMIKNVKAGQASIQDRGVRTAPFYVLIGANMPSVLAEISFVSNPDDERLLARPDQRDKIAESLFQGIEAYLEGLNHTPPPRQLTAVSRASRVEARGMKKR